MEKIKFRAWDKENKKMYAVDEIYFRGRYIRVDKPETKNDYTRFYNLDDVDLLQFTGLNDKNGNEIYEGDILKLSPPCKEANIVVKIGKFFDEDVDDWFVGVYGENADGCASLYQENGELLQYCEVIGNIYEQPEFLEGETK